MASAEEGPLMPPPQTSLATLIVSPRNSTVTSTGICPFCHRQASPVTRLYAELSNDQASPIDAVFWMLVGGFIVSLFWWVPWVVT